MLEKFSNLGVWQKFFLGISASLILYLISAFASFFITKAFFIGEVSFLTPAAKLIGITSKPEAGDIPCKLNGAKYSKTQADNWSKRRPLGVMIENHVDARPQSGISRADVIYEAVAEGGITRFLAIYHCADAGDIAPVRSARTYFLDWLSEYEAVYSHVGGANTPGPANALGQIRQYGIYDLDQFGLGFPTYWRSTDKFAPHNVHTTTEKLWAEAEKRGWGAVDASTGQTWDKNFRTWNFKEDIPQELRPASGSAVVEFWASQPQYSVTWKYDPEKNAYLRYHADLAQTDPLTQEQILAKVVIVQFLQERTARDGYPGDLHLLYKTIGSGNALIFQDGKVIEATWRKKGRVDRTLFLAENGQEITSNRGLIFIQTVPVGAKVTY